MSEAKFISKLDMSKHGKVGVADKNDWKVGVVFDKNEYKMSMAVWV